MNILKQMHMTNNVETYSSLTGLSFIEVDLVYGGKPCDCYCLEKVGNGDIMNYVEKFIGLKSYEGNCRSSCANMNMQFLKCNISHRSIYGSNYISGSKVWQ